MTSNKLSHKKWKSLIKKEKRKYKRQQLAQRANICDITKNDEGSNDEETEALENERKLQHLLWLERERLAQEEYRAKKIREEKEKERREEEQKKIREDFEKEQERLKLEKQAKENKINEFLDKKSQIKESSNDWHNPLAPEGCSNEIPQENICGFFKRVGACRFGNKCQRIHQIPEVSRTLLIPGMFHNYELEHFFRDEFDTDQTLECEDKDIYDEFIAFYDEVYPEFKSVGRLINFVVCCNYEPHMRGNVYAEYKTEEEAIKGFKKFNGRWFDKKQLSCSFANISSWKSAICGLFHTNRCPKGKNCNFMHIFKNPQNESRYSSSRNSSRSKNYCRHKDRSPSKTSSYKSESSRYRSRRSSHKRSLNQEDIRNVMRSRSRSYSNHRERSYHKKLKKGSNRNRTQALSRSKSRSISRKKINQKETRSKKPHSRIISGQSEQKDTSLDSKLTYTKNNLYGNRSSRSRTKSREYSLSRSSRSKCLEFNKNNIIKNNSRDLHNESRYSRSKSFEISDSLLSESELDNNNIKILEQCSKSSNLVNLLDVGANNSFERENLKIKNNFNENNDVILYLNDEKIISNINFEEKICDINNIYMHNNPNVSLNHLNNTNNNISNESNLKTKLSTSNSNVFKPNIILSDIDKSLCEPSNFIVKLTEVFNKKEGIFKQ